MEPVAAEGAVAVRQQCLSALVVAISYGQLLTALMGVTMEMVGVALWGQDQSGGSLFVPFLHSMPLMKERVKTRERCSLLKDQCAA